MSVADLSKRYLEPPNGDVMIDVDPQVLAARRAGRRCFRGAKSGAIGASAIVVVALEVFALVADCAPSEFVFTMPGGPLQRDTKSVLSWSPPRYLWPDIRPWPGGTDKNSMEVTTASESPLMARRLAR